MPSFLVFGCANFYGRALIQHLCAERDKSPDKKATWEIRGVDKQLPRLALLPQGTLELFDTFDFRMGNLRNTDFLEQAFAGRQWDYVFNFAAEYKFGQPRQVYEQDVINVSSRISMLASQHGKVLVHLSTAHIFKPNTERHKEEDALDAPNALAECHIKAEAEVRKNPCVVILRPALCYGPGDRQNVVPMLIAAQLSRASGEKMPVLWDRNLRVNTVHVEDVARAALATARWMITSEQGGEEKGKVFNLSDPGDTTNAKLAVAVGSLFGVEPSFQNSAVNFIAKRLKTSELTEEVNESLLGPWMELLARHNVANSPLSPYLDQEHPYCRLEHWPLGIDGSKITAMGLGFQYTYKAVTADALRPMIEEFRQLGLWP
ncbi:hypothetical protein GGI26_001115 [Coemansia sp. RSA 1358]|nr:hypothetical protein GGI26_001115 [Coemansia sp. RSA 1358]